MNEVSIAQASHASEDASCLDDKNKPTVCQVLHSLGIGGAEVLAAGLARSLSNRFRFVFACLDDIGEFGEELKAEGFHVELLNRRDGIDWRCGFRLAKFLKQHHVDVVHAHQYTPFFQAMLARLACRGLPIVFTEHGRHFPDSRNVKRVAVNKLLSSRKDRFIGVGNAVRDALVANEGLSANRVEVIYNGVNLRPFEAVRGDQALRKRTRAKLGIADDELMVLQVARLNLLKDHLTAVESIELLARKNVKARLVLAGEGETRPQIEAKVAELGLAREVQLLGARSDIPQLLAGADVFLLSSISEGIPLTLIEAMAVGVPIVATDVGGNSEVVCHEQSGLLCQSKNAKQIAASLLRIRDDSTLVGQLVENASRNARQRFDLDAMHEAYVQVYEGGESACLSSIN